MAAVAKYHMLGGSKQQKFTLLHSGGQMSQIGITGLIPSCQQAHTPSRGFRGKPTFLLPPASGGCQHSLTHSRSSRCLHGHTVFSFSACFESPSSSLLCAHFFFFIAFSAYPNNLELSSHLMSLNRIYKDTTFTDPRD